MPANSRIIPVEFSGMLLVTDTAPNLKKMYDLIKDNDVKPTAEMKKRWAEQEKAYEKRKLVEAGQPKKPDETLRVVPSMPAPQPSSH